MIEPVANESSPPSLEQVGSVELQMHPPRMGARALAMWRQFVDRWRRRLERLRFGNLASRLEPAGDLRVVDGKLNSVGLDPYFLLPGRKYAPGFYVMVVHVRGAERRGFAKLYVDDGTDFSEERAYGLVTKQEKSVFRIVHLPAGATRLRFDPAEEEGPVQVPLFRFHRAPRFLAWRAMLRRIGLEHSRLSGAHREQIRLAIAAYARARRLSQDEAVFGLYCATFGVRRGTGDYSAWMELVEASENEAVTPWPAERPGPTISVLLPVFDPRPDHLRACIDSVLSQSYPHVELCIADDASVNPEVRQIIEGYARANPRVLTHYRAENGHICRASNDALALATGEYVALLDHDDLLAEHALMRVAVAIQSNPGAKLLYGDEDKLSEDGKRLGPHFKSEYNCDLLLSQAYMGHLVVLSASESRRIGGFRVGYEGSQDHDLVLRVSECCEPSEIIHIPFILYHWRESEGSTALRPAAKSYAADAGLRAVRDALRRRRLSARAELAPLVPHGYRVRYDLPTPPPLVSILVPTRDAADLLRVSVGSVLERTDYSNFELIVLDNGSVEPQTFAYFEELRMDPRVRILRDDRPFNFSAINNFGVAQARGDVLALVNNDIEATDGGWLEEMVSHALRPEIGCVGAKLLYPDDRVQHAGVITGIGGVAGHAHKYLHRDDPGYFGRAALIHNLSAVTAACLVVRRTVFEQVGGFDETLAVAFNDVDFCLRVRLAGYRNLFTPYAALYHRESATRGHEETEAQQERFKRESETMKVRWGAALRNDPYYSSHLTLEREDFAVSCRT